MTCVCFCNRFSTSDLTLASFATSVLTKIPSLPVSLIRRTVSCPSLERRAATTILIPSFARAIAVALPIPAVHMSFGDIGKIIKKINGQDNDNGTDMSNKSKVTKALWLFENGKRPIDIAIVLDMPYSEVVELQVEYWALTQLYELPLVYRQLKHDFDSFIELFKLLKKNKVLSKQCILKFLSYADEELPTLEKKCQMPSSDVLKLQFRKKKLGDEVATQCSSISQLEKSLNWYKTEIEQKKQIISNLNQQLNQKSNAFEELSTQANKQLESVL